MMVNNKLVFLGLVFVILTAGLTFALTESDFEAGLDNINSQGVVSTPDYQTPDLKWFADEEARTSFLNNQNTFSWKGYDEDLSGKRLLIIADSSDWQSVLKATTLATNIQLYRPSSGEGSLRISDYEGFGVVHEGDYYPIRKLLENGLYDAVLAFGKNSFCDESKNKQSFFASYKNESVYCMDNSDYINRWATKNSGSTNTPSQNLLLVVSENNYDAAIIASTIASTLNAPLLIDGVDRFVSSNERLYFGNYAYFLPTYADRTPNVKIITVVNDQASSLTQLYPSSDAANFTTNFRNIQEKYKGTNKYPSQFMEQSIFELNTNAAKLYSFQTKLLSYKRKYATPLNPGDVKQRIDDHLIVYNPKDIDGFCSTKYSEYLKETSGLSKAPSTFCRDSLVVPYFAAVRGGILMPLRGDADLVVSNFNEDLGIFLADVSKENSLNSDLTYSFFGLKGKSNVLINSLRNLFWQQKIFRQEDNIKDSKEIFVSVIGNPYTVPFFYNDQFFQITTEPYLLADKSYKNLADKQELFWDITRVGWLTGLTPGDTAALVTKSFFNGYLHSRYTDSNLANDDGLVYGRFYDNNVKQKLSVGLATTTSSDFRFTDPFVWQDLSNFAGDQRLPSDPISITPMFIEQICNAKSNSIQIYSKEEDSKNIKNSEGLPYLDAFSMDIQFDYDKDKVLDVSSRQLKKLVDDWNSLEKQLGTSNLISIKLSANTDADGTNEYNKDLSQRRANAVEKLLKDYGFSGTIVSEANGEEKPRNLTQEDIDLYLSDYIVPNKLTFEPHELTQDYIDSVWDKCKLLDDDFSDATCDYLRKEVLMRLNRRVDFEVSIKESPRVTKETVDGKDKYLISLPQQEISKSSDCTKTEFNYMNYDIFYYLGDKDVDGGLKGMPTLGVDEKSKNNLMFFETNANLLDFDSNEPPLALRYLREGSRGIYISSSENSIKSNQGQFFLRVLRRPYETNLKTGELPSVLFGNYIKWVPSESRLESCISGGSCEADTLLERAQSRYDNKFRLLGDPLSTVMNQQNFRGAADLVPVSKSLEESRPMILFSAIKQSDVAFLNSVNDRVKIKSMKDGVFEWWSSALKSDFSTQSNIIPVLADGNSKKATVLVASSEPVFVEATLIDLAVDGCIENVVGSTVFERDPKLKIKLELPGLKFNKFESYCPYQSFSEKLKEKRAKKSSGTYSAISTGSGSFELSYTPGKVVSFGTPTDYKKSGFTECKKASKGDVYSEDDFQMFLNVDGIKPLDLYICEVEVPGLDASTTLVNKVDRKATAFYKDALVRFEIVDKFDKKEGGGETNTFSASSTLRLRYVYDLDALNSKLASKETKGKIDGSSTPDVDVDVGSFVQPIKGKKILEDGILNFKLTSEYFTGMRTSMVKGNELGGKYNQPNSLLYLQTGYEILDLRPRSDWNEKISDYWVVSNPFYYGGSAWFRGAVVTDESKIGGLNLSSINTPNLNTERSNWESEFDRLTKDEKTLFPDFRDSILASLMRPDKLSAVDMETYYPYDVAAQVWIQSDVFDDGSLIIDLDFEGRPYSVVDDVTGEKKPNILTERTIQEDINAEIMAELNSKYPDLSTVEKNVLVSNYMAVTIYPRFKLASTKLFSEVSQGMDLATKYLGASDLLTDQLTVVVDELGGKEIPLFETIDSRYFLTEDEYATLKEAGFGYSGANSGEQHFVSLMATEDPELNCYNGDTSRFRGGYTYVLPSLTALGNDLGLETKKPVIYVS
ncbi:OmpA family protein [Candidatus Woesearchaeota archaeon]|nr:OmpA family protein [Candidatus Woesearchaeota archaeon]